MLNPSNQRRVLVVHGTGRWLGLAQLPSILHDAGCHITALGQSTGHLLNSRFIDRRIALPESRDQVVGALRRHLELQFRPYDLIVIGNEETLVDLAAMKDRSWMRGVLPVATDDLSLSCILSKATFATRAAEFGVPVPRSEVANDLNELRNAATRVGYPIILKTARGSAGLGVRRVDSPAGLAAAIESLLHCPAAGTLLAGVWPVLVQEFVEGKIASSQVAYCHGRLIAYFSSFKHLSLPHPFGPSCVRQIANPPQVEPMLAAAGRLTGFHGICGVDWMACDDGRHVVIEFNPRPAPALGLAGVCGVDFAAAVADLVSGRSNAPIRRPTTDNDGRLAYLFPQHIASCIHTRDPAGLRHWFTGAINDFAPVETKITRMHIRWLIERLGIRLKTDFQSGIRGLKRRIGRPAAGTVTAASIRSGLQSNKDERTAFERVGASHTVNPDASRPATAAAVRSNAA